MIITVLRARDFFNFALPDKASGQYLIYIDSGLLAGAISSIGGKWVLSLEKGFRFAATPNNKDDPCIIRENISITSFIMTILMKSFSRDMRILNELSL